MRSPRRCSSHFGRLLHRCSSSAPCRREHMLAHVEFEGEERVSRGARAGPGVLLFTGHFGFWEINALVHALALAPMAVLARPLDNPLLHDLLESVRTRDRQRGDLPPRRDPPRAARARGESGGGVPDRSAHAAGRRGLRRLLQSPCGDDIGAGGAGVSDRRAGRAGVRAAAAGRTLPDGLRAPRRAAARRRRGCRSASSRSAAPTCSRCTCAGIRTCGCGCIAAGGMCPRASRSAECFRPRPRRSRGRPGRTRPDLIAVAIVADMRAPGPRS